MSEREEKVDNGGYSFAKNGEAQNQNFAKNGEAQNLRRKGEKMEREKLSGEFAPGGVECVAGHGELHGAVSADEVRQVLFAGEELGLKGVVLGKLKHTYHAFCRAVWAQPMRGASVCGRFLQYIGRKARSKRFQLIAAEIRSGLFECEKFCFERVAFHSYGLMLLEEREIRGLMLNELLLKVDDGSVDLGVVRKVADCFDRLKECFERSREACCGGDNGGDVEHVAVPLAC